MVLNVVRSDRAGRSTTFIWENPDTWCPGELVWLLLVASNPLRPSLSLSLVEQQNRKRRSSSSGVTKGLCLPTHKLQSGLLWHLPQMKPDSLITKFLLMHPFQLFNVYLEVAGYTLSNNSSQSTTYDRSRVKTHSCVPLWKKKLVGVEVAMRQKFLQPGNTWHQEDNLTLYQSIYLVRRKHNEAVCVPFGTVPF